MSTKSSRKKPDPEVRELSPAEAHAFMVEHFGLEDPVTQPMPLEGLPAQPELVPIERDLWLQLMSKWGK